MIKTFEYKLRPNNKQEALLKSQLFLTCELYNQALTELIGYYEQHKRYLSFFEHGKRHGVVEHPDIPAVLVDTALKRLHKSFSNFFRGIKQKRKIGFPRFKTLNRWHSLDFRDFNSNGVEGNTFKAGKKCGGKIKFIKHRNLSGTPKHCRIIKRVSGWYLQVICENILVKNLPTTDREIGIDFGIKNLISDSNGHFVENPRFLARSLNRLKLNQRKLSRRKKGSKRYNKQGRAAARIHEKIRNQRKDYFRKITLELVRKYDKIYIEDLNLIELMKIQYNGRHLADSAIGMLKDYLVSLVERTGKEIFLVPAYFTSQKCSSCGELVKKSLSIRTHICKCGYVDDRDTNAAKNILRLGQSLRGASAMKREAQKL